MIISITRQNILKITSSLLCVLTLLSALRLKAANAPRQEAARAKRGHNDLSVIASRTGQNGLVCMSTLIFNSCNTHSAKSFSIPASYSYFQQGPALQGTNKTGDNTAYEHEGIAVAISADGNTMVSGGLGDNDNSGALWVYVRVGGVWSQQGTKLTGSNSRVNSILGSSIAISGDGNTILAGGELDNGGIGAVWTFTRTGTEWSQQGSKLLASDENGKGSFGLAVSLSSDGNSAIIGGPSDASNRGAIWFFSRAGNTWTQNGLKISGNDKEALGRSVAISGDGLTAVSGAPGSDNDAAGISYVYSYDGTTWNLQGNLIGTGDIGSAQQGNCVAISGDGNTILMGAFNDITGKGAAWIFNRVAITWTQSGQKLQPADFSGGSLTSVCLSSDGTVAILGNHYYTLSTGVVWVYELAGGTWSQYGQKLMGDSNFGSSVAVSSDGSTIVAGASTYGKGLGGNFVYSASLVAPVQSSKIVLTNLAATSSTASWKNGNGTFHAVFVTPGAGTPASTLYPVNATTYTSNTTFGIGSEIGSAESYCVYNGPDSTVNITGLVSGTTYTVQVFDYNGTAGNEIYNQLQSDGNPLNFTTIQVPSISTNGTLSVLSTTFGTPSATGTFIVSGKGLSTGILVSPPAGYEVSASQISGFTTTVTIGARGTVDSTPVYIRLSALTGAGSAYSGNIRLSSEGAQNQTIATVSGTVTPRLLTLAVINVLKIYGNALVPGANTSNFSTIGLVSADTISSVMLTPDAAGLSAGSPAGTSYTVEPSLPVGNGRFNISNYTIVYTGFNGKVGPRVLHLTATGVDKIYDSSITANVALADDRVAGDIFTVNYASASFAGRNTGSSKPVTVAGVTITGPAAINYMVAPTVLTTASIKGAPVIVTAIASTKVYDGTTSSAAMPDISGLFTGDVASIFPIQTYNTPSVGSDKTLTPSGLSIADDNGGADYIITYQASDSGKITSVPDPVPIATKVIANNIVSPNGDGVNDSWSVAGILNFPQNSVTVYNRSGKIVFAQKGYANNWGCSYRGALLPQDTYYYTIDLGDGSKIRKGFITMLHDHN